MNNIDLSIVFNNYVLLIIGFFLEIVGAFLLSIEAIGRIRINTIILRIERYSNWVKRSNVRLTILIIPPFLILTIGYVFNSELIVALTIPVLFVSFFISFIIDFYSYFRDMVNQEIRNKSLGPFGFLLLSFGATLQLINVLLNLPYEV